MLRLISTSFTKPVESNMEDQGPILGYTLEPIYDCKPGYIYTAAVLSCGSCGTVIRSMGGPGSNTVCLKCVEKLNMLNALQQ